MAWFHRFANVFRTEKLYAELDDEIRFHIDERTDELMALGMSRSAARREAMRRFGNVAAQREAVRDANVSGTFDAFVGDLRYGARQLRHNPGFATVAILSLALGIGANSAIFQLINALQLRELPVERADQLVTFGTNEDFYTAGSYQSRHRAFSYAQMDQVLTHQKAFQGLLLFAPAAFNLNPGGEARYADGIFVTPNFLEVLGVEPVIGAAFDPSADLEDCREVGALLNHTFWQREFGGDPGVLGRQIQLEGRSFDIRGVTPPSFFGLEPGRRFDVALPLCADAMLEGGRGRFEALGTWWLTPIGRLKPGWSVERATAHLRDLSPAVFRETVPTTYRPDAVERYHRNILTAVPAAAGISTLREAYQSPLWMLLACTGLVLLLACANLANLLLARASVREREIALRQAVGASRRRLIAQLMSESLMLAGLGALLGALVAQGLSRSLVAFLDQGGESVYMPATVDWRVVGFTAALAAVTCLLFGWAPALQASRSAPAEAMRGGRGSSPGTAQQGLRRLLVVAQIGLSMVLLVGALLFGQSLRNILATDSGIDSENVLLANIVAPSPTVPAERRGQVFEALEQSLGALPDVSSVASVLMTPFSGSGWNQRTYSDEGVATDSHLAWFNRISTDYFETLGTPLVSGRDFTLADRDTKAEVAIINRELARLLYGEQNPIGRTLRYRAAAGTEDPTFRIVGVVGNTKYYELQEETRPMAFLPLTDDPWPEGLSFALRVRGSLDGARRGVEAAMADVDRSLQVEFGLMDEQIQATLMREKLMAHLSAGFGLLAALLASLGLYGVMSYLVTCRRREIGLRMALGARSGRILKLVLREAGVLLAAGLALGIGASLALARFAESLLYGLPSNDVATLALGCLLLTTAAGLAVLTPLRRALGMHPASVLRDG